MEAAQTHWGKEGKCITCPLFLLEDSAPYQIALFRNQVEVFLCKVPFLCCTPDAPYRDLLVFHSKGLCCKDLLKLLEDGG